MDCSKTKVFLSEWYRMCCSFDGNEQNCPVTLGCGVVQCNSCRQLAMTGGDIVDIVQEWSDANQPKTRLSVLKEQYPRYKYKNTDGLPLICAGDLYGFSCTALDIKDCERCWNAPIEDGEE